MGEAEDYNHALLAMQDAFFEKMYVFRGGTEENCLSLAEI